MRDEILRQLGSLLVLPGFRSNGTRTARRVSAVLLQYSERSYTQDLQRGGPAKAEPLTALCFVYCQRGWRILGARRVQQILADAPHSDGG